MIVRRHLKAMLTCRAVALDYVFYASIWTTGWPRVGPVKEVAFIMIG